MAVDTSLFGVDLPAGTYAVGDKVQLKCVAGPEVVRSGRGAAILKRISVGRLCSVSGSFSLWKISVKNSDWIDPSISVGAEIKQATIFDERSGANASGNNCPLTPNSSWEVIAECVYGGTTTVANSLYCMVDVDYPSVSSIIDPDALQGVPTSIEHAKTGITVNAMGTITTSGWIVDNVDIFKAGYEYALTKTELTSASVYVVGFIALSSAAGMGGLTRIMPITAGVEQIRQRVEYASKLNKGPMDIKFMLFNDTAGTATTDNIDLIMDYVKRRV